MPDSTARVFSASWGRSLRAGAWTLLALCGAFAAWQLVTQGLSAGELLARLLVLGIALPSVVWLACLGLPPGRRPASWQPREAWVVAGLVLWIGIATGPLRELIAMLLPPRGTPAGETANTAYKLLVFVVMPALALRLAGQLPKSESTQGSRRRLIAIGVLLCAVAWGLQALMGREFRQTLAGRLDVARWSVAIPLAWLWMSLEAGLVEEFFFRRWLQSRLEAWTGSALLSLVLAAALFGLAHAPGLWLRGAALPEGLAAHPSAATALAYSLLTQGLAGLMFGVLWLRTRSLCLGVAVHGMLDVPAHLGRFMATWGL